jgi:hypothetical protein
MSYLPRWHEAYPKDARPVELTERCQGRALVHGGDARGAVRVDCRGKAEPMKIMLYL